MCDQISDAMFTTEQMFDNDESVGVTEAFEEGRQTGEAIEFGVGFIDSINCHTTMLSLDSDNRPADQLQTPHMVLRCDADGLARGVEPETPSGGARAKHSR